MWIAAACVALVCFAGVGVMSRLPAVPASVEAAIVAAEKRRTDRLRNREPLCGEAADGSAARHYEAAANAFARCRSELVEFLVVVDGVPSVRRRGKAGRSFDVVPADRVAAHRAALAAAIMEVQRGARCRDASGCAPDRSSQPFGFVAALHGEFLLRLADGDFANAVALWLDLTTMMQDHGAGPFTDDWSPDVLAKLSDDAATLLADGVDRLHAQMHERPFALMEELRTSIRDMQRSPPVDWCWQEVLAAWDHGFDPSERHLTQYDGVVGYIDILEPEARSAHGREAQWRLFEEAVSPFASISSVVSFRIGVAKHIDGSRRAALANVRSLQIGVAARLGRTLPTLIDPTTDAPFRVDEDGAFVVVHRLAPRPPDRWVRCP